MKSIYVHRANNKYWQIPIVLMALIGLFVFSVHAASFDCSKAGTEMEKTICSDSKLSALDEDLAKVYGEIRSQSKGDAEALSQLTKSQREWLAGLKQKKEGKIACTASTECLTISYQKRIKELQDKLSLVAKKAPSESGEEKKYPPYPDVWGAELPISKKVSYAGIDVVKMPDGDYLITYIKDWIKVKEKEKRVYVGKFLFSGRVIDFTTEEYNNFFDRIRNEKREIKSWLLVRSTATVFSDGSSMKLIWSTHPKYNLPFDNYMEIKDKYGKVLMQKKLLYLYNRPLKNEIPILERNFDYKGKYYYEKVNWPTELRYVPLGDDTFLIIGFLEYQDPPTIIIIRFGKDFKTKSDLLGKKIFLVDEGIYRKAQGRKEFPLNDQEANDFFYNYLTKQRGEK